jgi:hypothetical protein
MLRFSFQRGRIDVKTTSCHLLSELHSPRYHTRIANMLNLWIEKKGSFSNRGIKGAFKSIGDDEELKCCGRPCPRWAVKEGSPNRKGMRIERKNDWS